MHLQRLSSRASSLQSQPLLAECPITQGTKRTNGYPVHVPGRGNLHRPTATATSQETAQPAASNGTAQTRPPATTPAQPEAAPGVPKGPVSGPALAELLKRFKRLQNGSDIRGIAIDGVPNEPLTLSSGAVFFIGVGFAQWLHSKKLTRPVVSVGHDPRLSGALLESAFTCGLLAGGASAVHQVGLATTPAMFYSIIHTQNPENHSPVQYSGGVMLTASHLPFNSNGLKFFTKEGGLEKGDISEILQRATAAAAAAGVMVGDPVSEQSYLLQQAMALNTSTAVTTTDFLPTYSAMLRGLIKEGINHPSNYHFPLMGLKITVDAGNGSGGFFAEQVLGPLGADTTGSQFLNPDGTFPNHPPNPEHPAAMAAGSAAVLAVQADMGIVFDTDVDRSAIVDRSGGEINSNRFIALMSAVTLREHPGTTIVTDSVTSNGLAEFIAGLGGKHFRFKRGYKNVIGQGVKLNQQGIDTQLMMETSGHGALKENYFLDDGAYLAVKVVIELVRRRLAGQGDISDLLADLKMPLESKEVRIKIQNPDFKAVGGKALDAFHEHVKSGAHSEWSLEEVNHEGWRVNVDEGEGKKGWLLLRQSLHDPLLVLNVESEVAGGAVASLKHVLSFFKDGSLGSLPLDLAALQKAVGA